MSPDDISLLFHPSRRVGRVSCVAFWNHAAGGARPDITCLIANDAEVRRLNRFFRGKDQATDVLSFPPAKRQRLAGDMAISLDRARSRRPSAAIRSPTNCES